MTNTVCNRAMGSVDVRLKTDDPRWTAYVLDELGPAERAAVESALRRSPAARRAVTEIRRGADFLTAGFASELAAVDAPFVAPGSPAKTPSARRRVLRLVYGSGALAASIALAMTLSNPSSLSKGRRVEGLRGLGQAFIVHADESARGEWLARPQFDVSGDGAHDTAISLDPANGGSNAPAPQFTPLAHSGAFHYALGFDAPPQQPPPAQSLAGTVLPTTAASLGEAGVQLYAVTAPPQAEEERATERPAPAQAPPNVLFRWDVGTAAGEYLGLSADLSPAYGDILKLATTDGADAEGRRGQPPEAAPLPENPFLPVVANPLSTFSIDVDTAAYSRLRAALLAGQRFAPAEVRIEELLNYFHYDYAPPTDGRPLAVHAEIGACPWDASRRLARIGLRAADLAVGERPACNLVFLIDVSGSMAEPDKLPLLQQSMRMLVEQLGAGDRAAIVTYSDSAVVALGPTAGDQYAAINSAIDALRASGSTNAGDGLNLAYDAAAEAYIDGGANRVILCSDGDFNVGITSEQALTDLISQKAQTGVYLTVLGFGRNCYGDRRLEALADKGDGNYAYVGDLAEAHKVLVREATGTLLTVARDVKLQVEFNPALVESYRLIGYENRSLAAADFNNDERDAGELGAGQTVTALYELIPTAAFAAAHLADAPGDPTVDPLKYQTPSQLAAAALTARDGLETLTVKVRYKPYEAAQSELLETPVVDEQAAPDESTDDFRFAASVAGFGLVLRGSSCGAGWTLADAYELAAASLGADVDGLRAEFLDVISAASDLAP